MELIDRPSIRDKLYDADAITMRGVAMLNQEPAVDAAPVVHGRWIDSPNISECVVCSNCMSDNLSAQVVAPAPPWYNYCPNCGALMGGKEQDSGTD